MEHRKIGLLELDGVLTKLGTKVRGHEVHALYLGALTSTRLGLGPQGLLDVILGEDRRMGESLEDVNAAIGGLFGYWNSVVSEREAGRVRFANGDLPGPARLDCLREFAERRCEEFRWYVRGIDAGGDDPLEWGDLGRAVFEKLVQASAFFEAFAETLARGDEVDAADLGKTRELLLQTSAICEHLMADLMTVTERLRREALATSGAMHGRWTDDGVRIGGQAPRVRRNERCPCGSGRKRKQCCGTAGRAH
ncbi:SEC-C metal-binding domain-containing protein [Myxococcota bacterium]